MSRDVGSFIVYLSPMSSPAVETTCRACATPGTGRFCTECGAPLNAAPCPSCGEALTPGSKFCHHCGGAASAGAASAGPGVKTGGGLTTTLPWAVAGIAFLALFAMLAGKGLNTKRGSALDAPSNALPNPALDGVQGGQAAQGAGDGSAPFANGSAGSVRAPDISKMTPQEMADRLFNKIIALGEQGKADSAKAFAPMAFQAYSMVVDQQGHPLELDQRYDVGRIAEVTGALQVAKAQADTILQQHPDHLLGLLLAAHVAKLSGNTPAQQEYTRRFTAAKSSELAKKLPEYTQHRSDIDAGL